jgi:hypothetical protein
MKGLIRSLGLCTAILASSCVLVLQYADEEYRSTEKDNYEALQAAATLIAAGGVSVCAGPYESPVIASVGLGQGGWIVYFDVGVSSATAYFIYGRETVDSDWELILAVSAEDFDSYQGDIPIGEASFEDYMARAAIGSCLGPPSNVVFPTF